MLELLHFFHFSSSCLRKIAKSYCASFSHNFQILYSFSECKDDSLEVSYKTLLRFRNLYIDDASQASSERLND